MKIDISHTMRDTAPLRGLLDMVDDPTSIKEVAKRLKTLRGALGKSQVEMTAVVGGPTGANSLWAQYEGGVRWIHPTKAVKLCAAFGVTTEWIYRGQEHTLPGNLLDKIKAFQKASGGSVLSRYKKLPLLA